MAVDPTPNQTVITLKNCAGLSGAFEYACKWTGQSNSRPWGYPADGFDFAPELDLDLLGKTGVDLPSVVIPNNATRAIGQIEVLAVSGIFLAPLMWNTSSFLRLGTATVPQLGYAEVISNGVTTVTVKWIALPTNNGTVAGYIVRENGKWASYEQVRVLTPYLPQNDIEPPPAGGGTIWQAKLHSPYKTPNAAYAAGGQRLTLPAPYVLPGEVTTFDDLALFLPLTRREGIDGYGISEVADSTFSGVGTPTGHPILDITAGVFTFANAISATATLAGAYLIVDWESAGATKRSWARISTNNTTTFTPDAASWLGDGVPADPSSLAVTFDTATDEVIWTANGFANGDRVWFSGGTPPGGVTFGRVYFVRNKNGADRFQIAESMTNAIVDIAAGAVAVVGTRVWGFTCWVPHWRDSPYAWVPGPEFAYPNEDQQPRQPCHNRARGRVAWAYNDGQLAPMDGVADSKYGAMLPFAYRVGASIGKPMHMVALGFNSASLAPAPNPNYWAYPGIIGWWNYEQFAFATGLEDSNSALSKRWKRLTTFIAPQALIAAGSDKQLRYLAHCHVQGESDSLRDGGRELYLATITQFKEWSRRADIEAGLSPFAGGAKMPFAQPLLTIDPWEIDAPGGTYQGGGSDTDGILNNAIREAHTTDEFAGYTLTEDIPKLRYNNGTVDNAHFAGQGYSVQGARLAALILDILEHAIAHGSDALTTTTHPRLLRICNLALMYVGENQTEVTSLSGTSTLVRLLNAVLPEARNLLLSMKQWSWALREEPATKVHHTNPRYLYAYAVPGRAVSVIEIVPPTAAEGEITPTSVSAAQISPFTEVPAMAEKAPFVIERSPSGHRVLYTNVGELPGDVSVRVISDGVLHPERLPRRPTLRYVDKVVDPDRYSESFASALSWLLASMLAPALIKGDKGEAVAQRCLGKCSGFLRTSAASETVQRQQPTEFIPAHLKAR